MSFKVTNSDFFKERNKETVPAENDVAKEEDVLKIGRQDNVSASESSNQSAKNTNETASSTGNDDRSSKPKKEVPKADGLNVGAAVEAAVNDSIALLKKCGFPAQASEADKVLKNARRERFTIAVVGEFSRGKSTFINNFLERDFLPTGDLPTTAVTTRIRNHSKDVLAAFAPNNQKLYERELSPDAWKNLTIHNFSGNDFNGTVLVGIRSEWLGMANVEIIDTPGAGDLDEKRAQSLSETLLGCDAAIITISATNALSLSEKLFIEQRLISRKMPFLMLIITKSDTIKLEERNRVIQYVISKLKDWRMDIPVFVPGNVELPDDKFNSIIGLDKIRDQISEWILNPERTALTEKWVLGKTSNLISNAISSLKERKALLETSDIEQREKLISQKEDMLAEAALMWGNLKLKMYQKFNECYQLLTSKIDDYADSITERLQYEAAHTNNPAQWWKEDFPYRIKIELTNMAVSLENIVSRKIQEDANWYSHSIEKTFRSCVLFERTSIVDKELFDDFSVGKEIKFEALDKKRNMMRIATTVLSISGVVLFSSLGFMPIVATMGIGTGSTILSEKFFRKKIEDQRKMISDEIKRSVPIFIQNSLAESEKRIEAVYNNIIAEAEKSEQDWIETQRKAISDLGNSNENKDIEKIDNVLSALRAQLETLEKIG